ncbi:MAG: hypothetical protein KDC49_03010 [Saprospiraceae bacterium]|nr:hypothetical protein [Saprospiraceae bacterium]
MSTTELKERVLKKIETIQDDYLLEELLDFLDFETMKEPFVLSKSQTSAIREAKLQIAKGEVFTNAQIDDEIDQWLNK